ncbi:hypothetical protein GCM10028812_06990 [Ancylobacter sonchi]|nr:hypothetical protein [Ancylobacter sonchi]
MLNEIDGRNQDTASLGAGLKLLAHHEPYRARIEGPRAPLAG